VDYKRRVYAIRDLPTLPVIAQKVLAVADDDNASLGKLAGLISSDQALSMKVLALANSAYYGFRSKVGTIQHAAAVIGTEMLKQLSLSVLVYQSMGRRGRDRNEFWKHSFGAATAASLIAKRTGADSELSFMAGLVHDVGKIVIETHFPNDTDIQHTDVGGWMSPVNASMDNEFKTEHVATVQSAVDDQSESKAEVKAKLSGEVRVNFKSDYFPMEKMASPQMIAAIQGNSKPPEKAISGS